MLKPNTTQAFSVKRAEVEFHNFAALGELDRALSVYGHENVNRGMIIRNHAAFIGGMTPFLEVGANAGHTSYMLANEFGQSGFALDISADALKAGRALMEHWKLNRAPVRVAGDAAHLPFRDGSLRFVMTYQTLSQFMDIEKIFVEIKRVLAPGGVFLLAEEPLLRQLSLRLYRAPYYNLMKPWEKKLYDNGLLGYLVKDVIGADQEESFGIRQNHSMYLKDWDRLIKKHFVAQEYELFVPERGWGEKIVKDRAGSAWKAAHLLGGTLAAICRKEGTLPDTFPDMADFEMYLQCPDCQGSFRKEATGNLVCRMCGYRAPVEDETYTILTTEERAELYPGDRADIIDMSVEGHTAKLGSGWNEVQGTGGAQYRWIGAEASATLERVKQIPQKLRIRGHIHKLSFDSAKVVKFEAIVNGRSLGVQEYSRADLFVYERDLPPAPTYDVVIRPSPTFTCPPDRRELSVSVSMIRLIPRE